MKSSHSRVQVRRSFVFDSTYAKLTRPSGCSVISRLLPKAVRNTYAERYRSAVSPEPTAAQSNPVRRQTLAGSSACSAGSSAGRAPSRVRKRARRLGQQKSDCGRECQVARSGQPAAADVVICGCRWSADSRCGGRRKTHRAEMLGIRRDLRVRELVEHRRVAPPGRRRRVRAGLRHREGHQEYGTGSSRSVWRASHAVVSPPHRAHPVIAAMIAKMLAAAVLTGAAVPPSAAVRQRRMD